MRRKTSPSFGPGSLLSWWDHVTDAGLRRFEREGALEGILEALAATVALEVVGVLSQVPLARREALRRAGARALLQIGGQVPGAGDDEGEERAEALRLVAPYARDGLRALVGKEPPRAPSAAPAHVGDAELVGLVHARFDGFRSAEIAWRVRESPEAQRALGLLVRLEEERLLEDAPRGRGLRLAADGASSVRDPGQGRRVAELRVGGHEVELFRFDDGVVAAYAATAVTLRLGGERVASLVTRPGYAEARVEGATRVELDVGGSVAALEL